MILPTTHKHAATGVGLPVSAPVTDRHVTGNPPPSAVGGGCNIGTARFFQDQPLHALSIARTQMVEQIMAIYGRSSKNPVVYRRILEGYEFTTLQRTWQGLLEKTEPEFAHSANATQMIDA